MGGILVSFLKAKSPLSPGYGILFLSRGLLLCHHQPLIANLTVGTPPVHPLWVTCGYHLPSIPAPFC